MNTATPMQSFLERMRQRGAMQKRPNGQRGYFTEPLYTRYMGNTGLGEDGKLQTQNPTAIVPSKTGPVAIHEGEDLYQRSNGDVRVVPAKQSMAAPNATTPTEMPQRQMKAMARQMQIPGMSIGGWLKNAAGAVSSALNPVSSAVGAAGNVPNASQIGGQVARKITTTPIGGAAATPVINPTNITGGIANQNATPRPVRTITTDTPEPIMQNITVPQPAQTAARPVRQITTDNTVTPPPPEPIVQNIRTPETIARTPNTVYDNEADRLEREARMRNYAGGTTDSGTITNIPKVETPITPATPTTPTGKSYMDKAMANLASIMEGGSPAQKAIAQKQLNELRASQGLQQRVAGFEAAQGGLRPEAASAQQAMGRAIAGSQLAGAASDIASTEMLQRESAAQTLAQLAPSMQNMEINQQNQVADMVNKGFTREQINAQFGTNLSESEYQSLLGASARGQNAVSTAIASGDYAGANRLLNQQGLPSVDFSKPEAQYQLQQLQQAPALVEQGLSREEVNAKLGLNLSQADYDRILGATTRGQNMISALVSAGDYAGANAALQKAGLPPIDFSKIEAGESRQVLDDITTMLNSLGDDADPNVVRALTSLYGTVASKIWKTYGINIGNQTITNPDGSSSTIPDLISNIDNPTDEKTVQTVAKMSSGVATWLEAGNGDIVLEQLSTNDAWNSLYEKAKGGNTAAAQEMGTLLGAAMTNEAYIDGTSTMPPNAAQKAILEKYGIWREAEPSKSTIEATRASINDYIENGKDADAKKLYDSLTDKEKEALGSFDDLTRTGIASRADSIIAASDFTKLQGKSYDDPLVQAVMKKMQPTTMSYRNRIGKNDEFTGAPEVGTWIKYQTPDGERLLKVTFKGHLNTAGTSDRAYMELTDIEGNIYSTEGNSTKLIKGTNTKFTKKN
jgi:hypothetical protein